MYSLMVNYFVNNPDTLSSLGQTPVYWNRVGFRVIDFPGHLFYYPPRGLKTLHSKDKGRVYLLDRILLVAVPRRVDEAKLRFHSLENTSTKIIAQAMNDF